MPKIPMALYLKLILSYILVKWELGNNVKEGRETLGTKEEGNI